MPSLGLLPGENRAKQILRTIPQHLVDLYNSTCGNHVLQKRPALHASLEKVPEYVLQMMLFEVGAVKNADLAPLRSIGAVVDSVQFEDLVLIITLRDGRQVRQRPFENGGGPRPLPADVQAAAVIERIETTGNPVPIRRLTAISESGAGALPVTFGLENAYPNPFNAAVVVPFRVPQISADHGVRSDVTLKIYNLLGQPLRTLVQGMQAPGRHLVNWDGRDGRGNRVDSGMYIVRLKTDSAALSKKLLYLK
jgi:hypothetical protein